ncbi:hypothetical protein WICMUC_005006 [Wickerhamomyces mucosus]|uniref:SYO1-like TPR repeats domain-containing protein n=1 Tax=Wickerhamomyces mucosus TaxID=1378264 RepID=A0A9P8PBY2_9ASCO|nr:hypothetical protein WICMUC_005006 [Wickerhamomyces mucosus]
MGKLKKKSRSSKYRSNPVNKTLTKNDGTINNKQDENLKTNKIIPIINKLKSSIPNERSMAISTISVMIEDNKFRKLLLKEKLVQIILEQCLNDSNIEIVVESFGLLRNLVIEEGYDVSIYLWRQNIWKVIEINLLKSNNSFKEYIKDSKQFKNLEITLLFDYIENLLSLIFGLCDTCDDILEQIISNDKLSTIFKIIKEIFESNCLKFDQINPQLLISINLFNTILEFIYNLSTQSDEFITKFLNEFLSIWDSFKIMEFIFNCNKTNELSKILIQGIILQFVKSIDQTLISNIFQNIINTIKDIDIKDERLKLLTEFDNSNDLNLNKINEINKIKIQSRSKFQSIDLSIEIITATLEILSTLSNFEIDNQIERLLIGEIPEILLKLTEFIEFRSKSFIGLNNLNWLIINLELSNNLQWINNSKLIFDKIMNELIIEQDLDLDCKTSIFGILWSDLIMFGSEISIPLIFSQNSIDEVEKTIINNNENNDNDNENDDNDEYIIRLIGFLGNLAKFPNSIDLNFKISQLFFKILSILINDQNKNLIKFKIEILDLIYEIYSDKSFDYDSKIFIHYQYLNKLIELKSQLKHEIKLIDKNQNKELKLRGEEVSDNLSRFIQYKQDE